MDYLKPPTVLDNSIVVSIFQKILLNIKKCRLTHFKIIKI